MKYPEIKIMKQINTQPYRWCKEAVLLQITNGKSALTRISTKADENYCYHSQLLLNGKPLIQGNYPLCPTCCGLLARGYGIEKTDTPELKTIRDNINAEYQNIFTAVKNLQPLLGLFDSGYYVIADTELYPTTGDEYFFANVPDELTCISASCEDFWISDVCDVTSGFPSYIYPTQSNECLNIPHARTYLEKVIQDNSPRAIAYYDSGFLCALLDGHHKAYACALQGIPLKSLVIIPVTACCHTSQSETPYTICFSDITLPVSDFPLLQQGNTILSENETTIKTLYPPSGYVVSNITIEKYHNMPISEIAMQLYYYPTVKVLASFYAVSPEKLDITDENITKLMTSTNPYHYHELCCAMDFYERTDFPKALTIARNLINFYPTKKLFSFLLRHKIPETEQMIIDYLIEHDPTDEFWTLANSYWL